MALLPSLEAWPPRGEVRQGRRGDEDVGDPGRREPPQEEEVAGEESGLLAFLLQQQQAGDDLSAPEDPRLASFLLETDILAVANASARFAGFAGVPFFLRSSAISLSLV